MAREGRGSAEDVWGRAARAPGPAWACQTNLVVADIMRVLISTFPFSFIAVYTKSSDLRHLATFPTVMRGAKNAQ
jgi:hypothetical protein